MTLFPPDARLDRRPAPTDAQPRMTPRTFVGGFETTYMPAADVDIGEASGLLGRWSEHLDALRAAGVTRVRYPVRWHRVAQEAGAFDWSGTDRELAELRERGIDPIVDLVHHTSYPRRLAGGFSDPGFADELRAFVRAFGERYPWIPAYTLFNEPFATLFLAGHRSLWPPFDSGMAGLARLASTVLPAVSEAWRMLDQLLPTAEHVWIDTCESHEGTPGSPARHAELANDRRHLLLDLALGHDLDSQRPALASLIDSGGAALLDLPPVRVDVLGLDYYPHSEWWYTEGGGTAPSPAPRGFAAVAGDYHRRYGLPMLLAETNVRGFPSDRATWLKYMVEQYELAVASGIPLSGFTWFPMLDSSDWDSLLALPVRHRDPVGVYELTPGGAPRATEFTAAWALAASGAPAEALPAYRLQAPNDQKLRGFFSRADWRWQDPPHPEPPISAHPVVKDLVVLSHLRWDWVWQRPQHLVTRIARDRAGRGGRTWFVEEPIAADVSAPELWTEPAGEVTRVRLVVPFASAGGTAPMGFDHAAASSYVPLLRRLLADEGVPRPDVLAYTPMALDLATALEPRRIAYDVMDDLASFAQAPPGMRERQQELLRIADVVFAGGRTLQRGVLGCRPDCHLFASGVDLTHYATSRELRRAAVPERDEPRVAGYVGVIDERLDLGLIAELAAELPDWTIRLVGPVAKIDPAALPVAANIEYPGMAAYADLPAVMAGFDVALMPFALNDATRSISPTKTLEYLAAGLPVVSTAIADVVADYAHVVSVVGSAPDFAAACRELSEGDPENRDHLVRAIGEHQSWDAIAAAIGGLLEAPVLRLLGGQPDEAHRDATAAAIAGLEDPALGSARLSGPLVETLADAAVASATPFVRAPLLARLTAVERLHPAAGDERGACPTCAVPAPCPTAVACA